MARLIALIALALVLLAGCAGQATPAPAAPAATPDDVARDFVTALGSWQEATVRQLIASGSASETQLSAERGQWLGWATAPLGKQTGVEVTESTVDGSRASLVVRSVHEHGESGVRLSMVLVDAAWRVESWHSYRP
jgi:hypothetical protein